ncbi:MAG TPA: hypothetical protein VGF13_06095 [Verrucomicrobiae bacterium]|jgi:hypothetical protein
MGTKGDCGTRRLFILAGLVTATAFAQPEYKQLRYDEDYSHLRDSQRRTDFFDPSKYIPLTESGAGFFTLGARFVDAAYGTAVNVQRSGPTSRADYVGNQPSVMLEYEINRHLTFVANYAHFFAGPFLKESGPGEDVDFFTTWLTFKF